MLRNRVDENSTPCSAGQQVRPRAAAAGEARQGVRRPRPGRQRGGTHAPRHPPRPHHDVEHTRHRRAVVALPAGHRRGGRQGERGRRRWARAAAASCAEAPGLPRSAHSPPPHRPARGHKGMGVRCASAGGAGRLAAWGCSRPTVRRPLPTRHSTTHPKEKPTSRVMMARVRLYSGARLSGRWGWMGGKWVKREWLPACAGAHPAQRSLPMHAQPRSAQPRPPPQAHRW